MRTIDLTNSDRKAMITRRYRWDLEMYKWRLNAQGYAVRRIYEGKGKNRKAIDIRMHRQIMNAPDDMEVDHIDGNRLNNQRSNLRLCTHKQNLANRPMQVNNTSGYKGVSWSKQNKKWYAWITVDGKTECLGFYVNILKAAESYNKAAIKYYGEFASLNEL